MQGKSLAFFWQALERQQEKGLQIKPEPFAPYKKDSEKSSTQKKPLEFSNGF
jgi:hypothetical protein